MGLRDHCGWGGGAWVWHPSEGILASLSIVQKARQGGRGQPGFPLVSVICLSYLFCKLDLNKQQRRILSV